MDAKLTMKFQNEEIFDKQISDTSDVDEDEYEVDEIKADKWFSDVQVRKYRVSWLGYPPDQDTWEPEDNLTHCKDKLIAYKAAKERKKKQKLRYANDESFIASEDNGNDSPNVDRPSSSARKIKNIKKRPELSKLRVKQEEKEPKRPIKRSSRERSRELQKESFDCSDNEGPSTSSKDEDKVKRRPVKRAKFTSPMMLKKQEEGKIIPLDLKKKMKQEAALKEQKMHANKMSRPRRVIAQTDLGQSSGPLDFRLSDSDENQHQIAANSEEFSGQNALQEPEPFSCPSSPHQPEIHERGVEPIAEVEQQPAKQGPDLFGQGDESEIDNGALTIAEEPEEREQQQHEEVISAESAGKVTGRHQQEEQENHLLEDIDTDNINIKEMNISDVQQQPPLKLKLVRNVSGELESHPIQQQSPAGGTNDDFSRRTPPVKRRPRAAAVVANYTMKLDNRSELNLHQQEQKGKRRQMGIKRAAPSSSSSLSSTTGQISAQNLRRIRTLGNIDWDNWDTEEVIEQKQLDKFIPLEKEDDPFKYQPIQPLTVEGPVEGLTVQVYKEEGEKTGFDRGWEVESIIGLGEGNTCFVKFIGIEMPQQLPFEMVRRHAFQELSKYNEWITCKMNPDKRGNYWDQRLEEPMSWMSEKALASWLTWRDMKQSEATNIFNGGI